MKQIQVKKKYSVTLVFSLFAMLSLAAFESKAGNACDERDLSLARRQLQMAQRAFEQGHLSALELSIAQSNVQEVEYCAGVISLFQYCRGDERIYQVLQSEIAKPSEFSAIIDRLVKTKSVCARNR